MLEKIKKTADFILSKTTRKPRIAIILGTGLGGLANEISNQEVIPYKDIPDFPVSTVMGHKGQLILGRLSGQDVVAMQGRFHFYEGYTMQELTFPIRVMKFLGVELLILSNASGGLNPQFGIGDCMFIRDHINLMGTNPLLGRNYDELGPRFPDMKEVYDHTLIEKAIAIATREGIRYQQGVYAAVTGPTFETPSEYHYLRVLGADAVGMSTVPEAIIARHMNMSLFAISVITDLGVHGKIVEVSHEDVIKAASASEPHMTLIIKEMLENF
ncbi:MAG: purine-nucleoside phosphorylase [Bacteroidetes bacterium]|nr:purine-nucleoside phosphorylase [Bacteroidota bacterium]